MCRPVSEPHIIMVWPVVWFVIIIGVAEQPGISVVVMSSAFKSDAMYCFRASVNLFCIESGWPCRISRLLRCRSSSWVWVSSTDAVSIGSPS